MSKWRNLCHDQNTEQQCEWVQDDERLPVCLWRKVGKRKASCTVSTAARKRLSIPRGRRGSECTNYSDDQEQCNDHKNQCFWRPSSSRHSACVIRRSKSKSKSTSKSTIGRSTKPKPKPKSKPKPVRGSR